jgi:hypothetical protein
MAERHEHADQRQQENHETEQTGFSTWRFHVLPLFAMSASSLRFR